MSERGRLPGSGAASPLSQAPSQLPPSRFSLWKDPTPSSTPSTPSVGLAWPTSRNLHVPLSLSVYLSVCLSACLCLCFMSLCIHLPIASFSAGYPYHRICGTLIAHGHMASEQLNYWLYIHILRTADLVSAPADIHGRKLYNWLL